MLNLSFSEFDPQRTSTPASLSGKSCPRPAILTPILDLAQKVGGKPWNPKSNSITSLHAGERRLVISRGLASLRAEVLQLLSPGRAPRRAGRYRHVGF
jgi:hypothetical protein